MIDAQFSSIRDSARSLFKARPLIYLFGSILLTTLCWGCDGVDSTEREGGAGGGGEPEAGARLGGERAGGEEAGGERAGGEQEGLTEEGGGDREMGGMADAPQGCPEEAWGRSTELSDQDIRTQIHGDALWDGEAFWITWNQANEEGKFEVWAGRYDCALTPLVEPFAVSKIAEMNDVDPSIARSGEVIMIVWARDSSFAGGDMYNLSTPSRRFDRLSGAPLGEERVQLARALNDQGALDPLIGNQWMPKLVALPEGGFVLSGAWGSPERNSFMVYVQAISAEGEPIGEAHLADESGRDQNSPQLTISPNHVLDMIWSGSNESGAEGVWLKSWLTTPLSETAVGANAWRTTPLQNLTSNGWISASSGERDQLDGAAALESRPPLIGADEAGLSTLFASDRPPVQVSAVGLFSLAPQLNHGMITYYERLSGYRNKIWWHERSSDGELSPARLIEQTGPAAPYQLALAPLLGGHLLLWSQGENPNFKLFGRLVSHR